jgi:methanogenic corrinoid protein MtbC1
MVDELAVAISDLEEERSLELVRARLAKGDDGLSILTSCQEGMKSVGERFEAGEYFISDLMISGEILKRATEVIAPHIKTGASGNKGKVVFGTVKGDIHNIGKDIVVGLLQASGYEVFDLGVDVPAQKFVDAVKDTGAQVLGLSGLLTVAFDSMKETIEALRTANLRSGVKVMIGGSLMSEQVKDFAGADAYGTNAQVAVTLCNQWLGGAK